MKQRFDFNTGLVNHSAFTKNERKVTTYELHAVVSFNKLESIIIPNCVIVKFTNTYSKFATSTRNMYGERIIVINILKHATLNPVDKFNITTGQRIAQSRAYIKYYYMMQRLFKLVNDYYNKIGFVVNNGLAMNNQWNFSDKRYREEQHLKALIESTNGVGNTKE